MKLSNTNQRKIILEELRMVSTHPTADELYAIVRKRLPRISLATVYRNLDLLAEAGQIRKLEVTGKQKRYDGRMDPHYHLCCKKCGAIEDLDLPSLDPVRQKLEAVFDRKIHAVKIEFTGLCGNCLLQKDVC